MTLKKFSLLLIIALLCGCSSVIHEEESSNKTYTYKLSFDDEDIDETYKDADYVLLEGDSDFTIEKAGTYVLSGELNGSIIVNCNGDVKLILDGVTINSDNFAAIYIKKCDKCTITLAEGSENVLSDSGDEYVQVDDNSVDALIFSKADLVFNGSGTLNINANYKHGIVSKDSLIVTNGTYNINSNNQGICGKDCVKIKAGTFNIESGKAAIKSNNDEDEGRGYIYIYDGTFNISSDDKGISAYNDLIIDGGNINITKSYEGLEAAVITINDGDISIVSSDDGINAASKNNGSSTFKMNGGSVYINAEGDGIDSNGDIYISGGTLFVEGPISGGDAAFDYDTAAYISGGEILMIGQSDMAEGFNEDGSSQVSLLYNMDSSYVAGGKLTITVNDETIFDETINKQFNSILLSSGKFSIGDEVTITVNDDIYTYTLESMSNTYGSTGFGQGGMGQGGDFDPNGERPSDDNKGNPPGDGQMPNMPENSEMPSKQDSDNEN